MFNLSMVSDYLFECVQNPKHDTEESYIQFIKLCADNFTGEFKITEETSDNIKKVIKEYRLYRTDLEEKAQKLQEILNDSLVKPFTHMDFTYD